MAVDPHTLKLIAQAVISQITDEEKRQRLIIGIIIAIVIMVFIILIPIFAITSTIDTIKSFFGFGEDLLIQLKAFLVLEKMEKQQTIPIIH